MIIPPFNNPIVSLDDCVLTHSPSTADAELLSVAFAASEPWLSLSISAIGLKNYLLREDSHLYRYTVRINDEVAGMICIRYPWLRGPYIELLGLTENYRGHGIGSQLLNWAETEARHQANNLWLVTSSFNHRALQFYVRHGFQHIGNIEGLIHPEYDEILLRKRLL
jgi:ribosomal protein S18 acetylase RimI-like enzyme